MGRISLGTIFKLVEKNKEIKILSPTKRNRNSNEIEIRFFFWDIKRDEMKRPF
jgi:hypothetical protein